ncbi:DNA polymerase-4 [Amycolatopsis xylanica]|uniref:DNA polymerase IV n=1 Tax=Amycolatopsis xylanica TaxID=589385 RepID=A0A1H3P564_9PSEU|nr:DNA polymerase IV [Amycolatopsis xylanica]SDY96170.1 DNA polymerase-4 [Amycolatopsis xylanica]
MKDWILHFDLDQFIAAVEVARHPELRGLPVVVGGTGDPTQRAVVATASYEAREFGIHSGMPLRLAKKRCPEAIFLPSDAPAYLEVSARVMDTLREFPIVVEVMGWDEAFLGAHTDDPEALAQELRQAVTDSTGLASSIGIGDNKLRAKLATGFAKPAGIYRLTKENWAEVMGSRPTDALWGIGAKTTKKLAALGMHTVDELAAADPAMLAERFGPTMGPWFRVLAHGFGDTEVTATPYVPRSRSRETTFQQDLTESEDITAQIKVLAQRVFEDVVAEDRPVARVAVKVRFKPFFTQTRSMTLPGPIASAADLEAAALTVLAKFDLDRPVRLLGVRAEFKDS